MILPILSLLIAYTQAFTPSHLSVGWSFQSSTSSLFSVPSTTASFIQTELRGAAMKLHTTQQAPKEGGINVKDESPKKRYIPTREDYVRFLVDSQHVFQTLEDFVNREEGLSLFQDTGLERVKGLETDINFLMSTYGLERPDVSKKAKWYAKHIGDIKSNPQFMCHYYNFYFAHTAGGLMIGKKMANLLLADKTLEFYKWKGDLQQMKEGVKGDIESMAATWSREEKDDCVNQTRYAFRGGGGVNFNLSGKNSSH